jgi:hypothetical protein
MDTITNEPAGVNDVVTSEDTSVNDTQPVETGEVNVTEPAEAGEAPTLLAGKYNSPQELEKAYNELQGKLGEQGQKAELVNLLERQTGMNANQIKEALAAQQQAQYQQQVQENPGLAAFQEVQSLKSQLALQNEEKVLNDFLSSEEGKPYADYKDDILEFGLLPKYQSTPFADIAREKFGKAIAQGQQSAYRKIESKVMTQATGVSQSTPKGKITPEEMDKMSVAELEAILPHADTSQRLY